MISITNDHSIRKKSFCLIRKQTDIIHCGQRLNSNSPGNFEMISSACDPIDPVDPNNAILSGMVCSLIIKIKYVFPGPEDFLYTKSQNEDVALKYTIPLNLQQWILLPLREPDLLFLSADWHYAYKLKQIIWMLYFNNKTCFHGPSCKDDCPIQCSRDKGFGFGDNIGSKMFVLEIILS